MKNRVDTGDLSKKQLTETQLEREGSAIGAARMNPADAYGPVPVLVKEYIDSGSENAWNEIRERIDKVYGTVSAALESLVDNVAFSEEMKIQVNSGKKLFFKVNLVNLPHIDYRNHGPGLIGVCTPWEFSAAVMRWFHDKQGITYYQMSIGEAGTTMSEDAAMVSRNTDQTVTTQAILEGKYGSHYGGWGFYFARKYLAQCHDPKHSDDPMNGYQDSIDGHCLAPGKIHDKLLVYDLNKVNETNGREIPVAGGINFKAITMHKVVVGGNPKDPQDLRDWPGCVLVNLPKLKIHILELFTGALKNIGVGLYPIEANASREQGKYDWKYAEPNLKMPLGKQRLPHERWSAVIDEDTCLPITDKKGNIIWKETGGMEATIADSIQAVKGQNIMTIHVMDAIEVTNIHHCAPPAVRVPEGYVFASVDPVAIDECASRYLFTMVPLTAAEDIRQKNNLTSDVIQKVPMPVLAGQNIVTGEGYDSSFSRYHALQHCEDRGLGQRKFYVVGQDLWQGGNLASFKRHLGHSIGGAFTELNTNTMYYTPNKPLWDLQKTLFTYLELNDKLTGSDYKSQVLKAFDQNGDGVIDYLERGRGSMAPMMVYERSLQNQKNIDAVAALKIKFLTSALRVKLTNQNWNSGGYSLGGQGNLEQALSRAMEMSHAREEKPDPMFPTRTWGNGKWPSLQYALYLQQFSDIYGRGFPERFDMERSLYGHAFNCAVIKSKKIQYSSSPGNRREDMIKKYHAAVATGEDLLPFTLYLPRGLGSYNKVLMPNVVETDDPDLILTARFSNNEVWRDFRVSSCHLE